MNTTRNNDTVGCMHDALQPTPRSTWWVFLCLPSRAHARGTLLFISDGIDRQKLDYVVVVCRTTISIDRYDATLSINPFGLQSLTAPKPQFPSVHNMR